MHISLARPTRIGAALSWSSKLANNEQPPVNPKRLPNLRAFHPERNPCRFLDDHWTLYLTTSHAHTKMEFGNSGSLSEGMHIPNQLLSTLMSRWGTNRCVIADGIHLDMDRLKKGEVK